MSHPVGHLIREAAFGRFPPADGAVEFFSAVEGLAGRVVGFSGHNVIATDLEPSEVRAHLTSSDPGAPMNPAFLAWLGVRLRAWHYTPDLVLAAFHCESDPTFSLVERDDLGTHPRVAMARRLRREVRVYSDTSDRGLLTIARSIAGERWEVSLEVKASYRGLGVGRKLARAARSLVDPNEPLFACVSPGNAASLRALLAAGYVPICSEMALMA